MNKTLSYRKPTIKRHSIGAYANTLPKREEGRAITPAYAKKHKNVIEL